MDAPILTLTDIARDRIKSVRESEKRPNAALRVTVREDGPAAYRYFLDFAEPEEKAAEDLAIDTGDFQIFIDEESAGRLRGAKLDYVEEISDSYFKFDNPNKPPLLADPTAARIQKVIEDKINPNVQQHGGRVTLMDFREGNVFIKLGGGCHGCSSSAVTLREGIETTIRAEVPEVRDIVDVTDHATGENPYFR